MFKYLRIWALTDYAMTVEYGLSSFNREEIENGINK